MRSHLLIALGVLILAAGAIWDIATPGVPWVLGSIAGAVGGVCIVAGFELRWHQ